MSRLRSSMAPSGRWVLALALVTFGSVACEPEPQPIAYGEDVGDFCHMTITDERYGSELVMETGRVYKFDSIECLAAFHLSEVDTSRVHSIWVTDFRNPGSLIRAEEAFFLRSPTLRSPMGMNLTAFGPDMDPVAAQNSFGGQALAWPAVLELVRQEGMPRPGAM